MAPNALSNRGHGGIRLLLYFLAVCVFGSSALLSGCQTSGNQLEVTVYDTHKRLVNLNKNLDASVARLKDTASNLADRVTETDQQIAELTKAVEDAQEKLTRLQREIAELKTRVFQAYNLSTAPAGVVSTPTATTPTAPSVPEPQNSTSPTPSTTPSPTPQTPPVNFTPPPAQTPAPATPAPARTQTPPAAPPQDQPQPAAPSTQAAPTPAMSGDPAQDYQQALRAYQVENYTEALQRFDAFLQRYPQASPEQLANVIFWKGKSQLMLGQYQDAAASFDKVVTSYPNSTKVPFALYNRGVALSRLGQTDMAKKLFQQVIEQYPVSAAADQAKIDLQRLGS